MGKIRAEVPEANNPAAHLLGLTVEEVEPGSELEKQILTELDAAIRAGIHQENTSVNRKEEKP